MYRHRHSMVCVCVRVRACMRVCLFSCVKLNERKVCITGSNSYLTSTFRYRPFNFLYSCIMPVLAVFYAYSQFLPESK